MRLTLGSLALLTALAAFFYKLIDKPHFPFGPMLATSIGLGLAVGAYTALVRLLSR